MSRTIGWRGISPELIDVLAIEFVIIAPNAAITDKICVYETCGRAADISDRHELAKHT